ncbi:MAG: hypothetical protein AAGA18_06460 [Verrucomicrobiota bacterium]
MHSIQFGNKKIELGLKRESYLGLAYYFPEAKEHDGNNFTLELKGNRFELFEHLNGFGPLLAIYSSGPVITKRIYSETYFHREKSSILEVDGYHIFNPQSISSIWVAEETISNRLVLSIQFYDLQQRGFLKLCLSTESDLDHFHQWIINLIDESPDHCTKSSCTSQSSKAHLDKVASKKSTYCKKVKECESLSIDPVSLPLLMRKAKEKNIPLQMQSISPAMRHCETIDFFETQELSQYATIEAKGLSVLLDTKLTHKATLCRPLNEITTPYALNIFGKCNSFHTVLVPALNMKDRRTTSWIEDLNKIYQSQA